MMSKKQLIEDLIKLGHITIDEAILLLSDDELTDFQEVTEDDSMWTSTSTLDINYIITY